MDVFWIYSAKLLNCSIVIVGLEGTNPNIHKNNSAANIALDVRTAAENIPKAGSSTRNWLKLIPHDYPSTRETASLVLEGHVGKVVLGLAAAVFEAGCDAASIHSGDTVAFCLQDVNV